MIDDDTARNAKRILDQILDVVPGLMMPWVAARRNMVEFTWETPSRHVNITVSFDGELDLYAEENLPHGGTKILIEEGSTALTPIMLDQLRALVA